MIKVVIHHNFTIKIGIWEKNNVTKKILTNFKITTLKAKTRYKILKIKSTSKNKKDKNFSNRC